jgi:hypothetical protein
MTERSVEVTECSMNGGKAWAIQRGDSVVLVRSEALTASDSPLNLHEILTGDLCAALLREKARADGAVEAAKAAIAYDDAIQACANDPETMTSFCSAEGDDLDSLYADWITKARAALSQPSAKEET